MEQLNLAYYNRNWLRLNITQIYSLPAMSAQTTSLATPKRKPLGYWQQWDNLARELNELITQQGKPGQMPSKNILTRAGRTDLINAIRYFGGQEAVAQRLDLTTNQTPSGYWNAFGRVEDALLAFIHSLGKPGIMPTIEQLKEHGYHGLCYAITKHGGQAVVAKQLGLTLTTNRHPIHYWDDFANVRLEIENFIQKHGTPGKLPGKTTLTRHQRYDLIGAIRLHGGMAIVAQKLGLAKISAKKPAGYWRQLANIAAAIDAYNRAQGTPGQMPGQIELNQAGYSSLSQAISVYHGGFAEVAKRLGLLYQGPRPPGYWHVWTHLEQELNDFIQTHGTPGQMPRLAELELHQRYDLGNAITYYGGYHAVAERLGLTTIYHPPGYWQSWDNLSRELHEWAKAYDHLGIMPTGERLIATGRDDLVGAFSKHGGLLVVADKLGWKTGQGQHRFPNWEAVADAVQQFIDEHGERGVIPTTTELAQHGRYDLLRAIYKWGGGLTQTAYRMGLHCPYPRESKWRTWSPLASELEAFIQQHGQPGEMPSVKLFQATGRGDLLYGILVYHGGISAVARRLGLSYAVEARAYWLDYDNVIAALLTFIEEEGLGGMMPTHQMLRTNGANSLSNAILNHGGSQAIAEQLGLDYAEKSPGYWRDWATLCRELEAFMDISGQPGVLPTQRQLREAGRNDLVAAIRFHGGVKAVAVRGQWRSKHTRGKK